MIRSRLKTFLKIAISAGLIVFLLTRLNRAELLDRLASTQPLWLAVALCLYFLAIFLGVLKWQMLVRVQHLNISYGNLAIYTFAGLFVGNILPSNIGGDLVRAYELAHAIRGPAESAVMSVVMDRLLGLVAFGGSALVSATLALMWLTPSRELETLQLAAVVVFGVVAASGVALLFSSKVARGLGLLFERSWLARLKPHTVRLYHAVQIYRRNYSALIANILLSASIILVATVAWYATGRALGLEIPLLYFFLFNPLVSLVLLLPISFNGLGPKEATAVFFFGLIGVPSASAFALSLLFHLIIVVTSLPGGILILRSRRPPADISSSNHRMQESSRYPDVK